MFTAFLAFMIFLFLGMTLFFAILSARRNSELESLSNKHDKDAFKMAEANLRLLSSNEELEEQREKLAEANLKMLEQQEKLEEQGFKLAEANLKMLEQNEIIEKERDRSEKLLLNILPMRIAKELKENGKTSPESFKNVTAFFSDIIGFTKMSSEIEPSELISELNEIFTAFDRIINKNGCERIKTIGDAYLCVSGMPVPDENHALNIAKSSIEILAYLRKRNSSSRLKWEIRIGIHSGPVVGGVVGLEKYIYDVFGDTINTASRMEAYSEAMKINVSEMTYNLIKDKYLFEERPSLEVKGKGLMKMYFLIEKDFTCQNKSCAKAPN